MKNIINKIIGVVSPKWAVARAKHEHQRALIESSTKWAKDRLSHRTEIAGGSLDRTNNNWLGSFNRGDPRDLGSINRVRNRAWDLVTNNATASQIVRTIVARLIGAGLRPMSLAKLPDGSEWKEFKARAVACYQRWELEADDKGLPGRGGLTLDNLYGLIVRELVVSGEVLVRFHRISRSDSEKSFLPLKLQVIGAGRLDSTKQGTIANGNTVFRGIEYDQSGYRVAYYIYNQDIYSPIAAITPGAYISVRVPVSDVLHISMPSTSESERGISWLAPIMQDLRDLDDLRSNEIMASAAAACHAMIITTEANSGGFAGQIFNTGTDSAGNAEVEWEPGMVTRLAPGQKVVDIQGQHPNTNVVELINGMLKQISTGVPGVKASCLTHDYRGSSFSSETSAENDQFYQIEYLQNYIFSALMEPVFEEMLRCAITFTDYFDDLLIPSDEKARKNQSIYSSAWKGPVSRQINPSAYEASVAAALANGTTSLQIECAKKGVDYDQMMADREAIVVDVASHNLPAPLASQLIGLKTQLLPMDLDGDTQQDEVNEGATEEDSEDKPQVVKK